MGIRDSSLTRAEPLFDQLLSLDPTGKSWLRGLLSLPHFRDDSASLDLPNVGEIVEGKWGENEKRLQPPRSLLAWLVRNPPCALAEQSDVSENTRRNRLALLERRSETIEEALDFLARQDIPNRAWYVLEGITRPDVYLETSELTIVIEAKRTESGPTTHTKMMPVRHQMLRHIDAAWDEVQPKRLFGFFIVEGTGDASSIDVPDHWLQAAFDTVSADVILRSLPHRSGEERVHIAKCFLGATTWQAVCRAFGISWSSLPDLVTDFGA